MRGAVGTAVSVTSLASGTPAPAASAGSSYPNIVFILVAESGVAFNNPHVLGPCVRELRKKSLLLSRHYVYKYCSPTRAARC